MEDRWSYWAAGTEVAKPGSGPLNELNPMGCYQADTQAPFRSLSGRLSCLSSNSSVRDYSDNPVTISFLSQDISGCSLLRTHYIPVFKIPGEIHFNDGEIPADLAVFPAISFGMYSPENP